MVVDDLASLRADAIVRPATTRLDPTTAALRRLETVGGVEFQRHLQMSRELGIGAAVVTAAGGDLPAEFVIHAVIRSDTEPVTPDGMARAWRAVLHQAQEWQFGHLSAPPLGTGAGNLPLDEAATIMVGALQAHQAVGSDGGGWPRDVTFVVEREEDRAIFEAVLRNPSPL